MDDNCPQGITALAIESSSLHELSWHHIVAPNLENFVFSSFSRKFTMSMSAPKLEEFSLECYLEDSIVGCAENKRWHLYKLKLEMGPSIRMESGRHGRQHIMSLYINNVMVHSDPFAVELPSLH
jgi:hypothetical protein